MRTKQFLLSIATFILTAIVAYFYVCSQGQTVNIDEDPFGMLLFIALLGSIGFAIFSFDKVRNVVDKMNNDKNENIA